MGSSFIRTELLLSAWVSTAEVALMTRQSPAATRAALGGRLEQLVRLIVE